MEKHFRVSEVAKLTGLSIFTIRRRLKERSLGYCKGKRAVFIPESEVKRLLGEYRAPVTLAVASRSTPRSAAGER